ncbi:MAG: putative lipase atg15 [Bogoriella megaspora]|nr:MAG: putative lipase atg15 [Bogoriella megaspora]
MVVRYGKSAGNLSATLFLTILALIGKSYATDGLQDPQAPLLPVIPPKNEPNHRGPQAESRQLDFRQRLRHIFHHGTWQHPELHRRLDIAQDASVYVYEDGSTSRRQPVPELRVRSRPLQIQRLKHRSHSDIDTILDYGREHGAPMPLGSSAWTIDEIEGPNATDKESVLTFAKMTQDAYVEDPNDPEWFDVGPNFNYTEHFGWESDGLRGHVFADTTNRTVVISLKGTSVFDGTETTTNDKINDNLFFGCCCGQGGSYLWKKVCDCQTTTYTCNSTCLVQALRHKNRYYYAAQDLYRNVTEIYPDANIWIAGHSLGGSTGSLLALTVGLPVITFEAPGDALPASRLGLPAPPEYHVGSHQTRDYTGGYHFGHTADPIFMGTCNTATSVCTLAGYDTVGDFGWRVGAGYHSIKRVITDVIDKYEQPANCTQDIGCADCFNWKYFESNGTETTTSSSSTSTSTSSSSTRTRTQTCKTPGWWGCLDESTTSTQTMTSTSTTTSCATPGWFGCKDGLTTKTITTTITSPPPPSSSSSSSSLASPAPKPSSTPATTIPSSSATTTTDSGPSTRSTTTCETPGRAWGCWDSATTTASSATAPISPTTPAPKAQDTSRSGAMGNWDWRSEI